MRFWDGASEFVSEIDAGSWPDWVAALAAVTAIIVGFGTYFSNRSAKRRSQAEQVAVRIGQSSSIARSLRFNVSVQNNSPFNVYDPVVMLRHPGYKRVVDVQEESIHASRTFVQGPDGSKEIAIYPSERLAPRFVPGGEGRPVRQPRRQVSVRPSRGVSMTVIVQSPDDFEWYLLFTDVEGRRWKKQLRDYKLRAAKAKHEPSVQVAMEGEQ